MSQPDRKRARVGASRSPERGADDPAVKGRVDAAGVPAAARVVPTQNSIVTLKSAENGVT